MSSNYDDLYQAGDGVFVYRNLARHYGEIFDGFDEREFLAFNAQFPAEDDADVTNTAVEIHLNRMAKVQASRYMLFTSGALRRARAFFKQIHTTIEQPELSKISVVSPNLSTFEHSAVSKKMSYFIGWNGLRPKCVLYLYGESSDVPVSVLVYLNNPVMHSIFEQHFEGLWKKFETEGQKVSDWFDLIDLNEIEWMVIVEIIKLFPGNGGKYTWKEGYSFSWDSIATKLNLNKKTYSRSMLDPLIDARYISQFSLKSQLRYQMTRRGFAWAIQRCPLSIM